MQGVMIMHELFSADALTPFAAVYSLSTCSMIFPMASTSTKIAAVPRRRVTGRAQERIDSWDHHQ